MSYAYEIQKLRSWVELTKSSLIPPMSYPEISIGVISLLEIIAFDSKTTLAELEELVQLFSPFELKTDREDYKRLNNATGQLEFRAETIKRYESEFDELFRVPDLEDTGTFDPNSILAED